MTKRSKRYFAIKRAHKYGDSILVTLMPILEAYQLSTETMKQIAKPVYKRPPGERYRSGMAIVGEVGPELVIMQEGSFIIPCDRLMEFPKGTIVIPAPSASL